MFRLFITRLFLFVLLVVSHAVTARVSAQEQEGIPLLATTPPTPAPPTPAPPGSTTDKLVVPAGTRLPLLLRIGINTRSAKAGDSIYLETAYPIAVKNKIVIPMGSFMRGEILEVKRPGRIKGRGEFRMVLNQMTLPNGYTIDLLAAPSSIDRGGQEEVTPNGRVTGPGAVGKDVGTVALATVVGGPVGGYTGILAGHASRGSVAIGHGVGAAAGLAIVLLTRGPEAEVPRGTTMDVIFDRPLILDSAYLPADTGAGLDPQQRSGPAPMDSRQVQKERQQKRITQSMLRSIFLPRF